MNIFELLVVRSKFEELIKNFVLPSTQSDIDNITWFLNNGHKSNSLRNGYGKAIKLANVIKEYADGCSKNTTGRLEMGPPR